MAETSGTVISPSKRVLGARFTPKKGALVKKKCSVSLCGASGDRHRDIVFHTIPVAGKSEVKIYNVKSDRIEIKDRRTAWLDNLRMDGKKVDKNTLICSLHFNRAEDYFYPDVPTSKRQLLSRAVPTVNLPPPAVSATSPSTAKIRKQKVLERQQRFEKRRQKLQDQFPAADGAARGAEIQDSEHDDLATPLNSSTDVEMSTVDHDPRAARHAPECTHDDDLMLQAALDTSAADSLNMDFEWSTPREEGPAVSAAPAEVVAHQDESAEHPRLPPPTSTPCRNNRDQNTMADSSIQVEIQLKFHETIKSDKKLHALTGISNFEIFNILSNLMKKIIPDKSNSALCAQGKLMLTFMKMRLNMPFHALAILFDVAESTAKLSFEHTIHALNNILTIPWPSQYEIRANLPKQFAKYQKTRIVLDCTEVRTTKTRCLLCGAKSYSHYKGCPTLKFLIGVSPGGLITYASAAYGGRASDRSIFEQSELLEKLDPLFDEIMVDKGFHINDLCEERNIKVIHPPFLRGKQGKFSRTEARSTASIAAARVHVERAIERVKKFRILKDGLPWSMARYATPMFKIICAMVNWSNPILADDKF